MKYLRNGIAVVALIAAGCASSTGVSQNAAHIPKPSILIIGRTDMTDVPAVASGITVHFEFRVTNNAQIPITLRRIDLEGLGAGGINIESKTRVFKTVIEPGTQQSADFATVAYISDPNTYAGRAPVQIRAVALFDSAEGSLQTIVQQQVSAQGSAD
jgi:hypothetical protein